MPHELGFGVWLLWIGSIPSPVWTSGTVQFNCFRWFFPQIWVVNSHTDNNQHLAEYSRGSFCRFLCFFFHGALLYLRFCPMNSSLFDLPKFSTLSPQLGKFIRLSLSSPVCTEACKIYQIVNWRNCRAYFIWYCLSSTTVLSFLCPGP